MPCPDMAPASVRGSQRDLAAAARVFSSLRRGVSPAAACASGRCRWPWRGRADGWSGTCCRSSWRSAWPSRWYPYLILLA